MPSIVILGAGPAGSFSALCLARRGYNVTVIEAGGTSTEASSTVRHARQGHSFLALGTSVLHKEAPDVVDLLISAGAHRIPLRHDANYWNLLMRRSLLDAAFRHTLSSEPRVRLFAGSRATGILITSHKTWPPRAIGVRIDNENITADLVVDAAGSFSPLPRWLSAAGVHPVVAKQNSRFIYITRPYRLKPGTSFPSTRVPILEDLDYATVLAFPEDNNHFQLSVQMDNTDPVWRALTRPDVFDEFLSLLPKMAPWVESGTAVADPEVFASRGNSRISVFPGRPLITALFMVGDASSHTNPTAGRGVSLALAHARALAELLDGRSSDSWPLAETTEAWERLTLGLMEPWLESQMTIDHSSKLKFQACLQGIKAPPESLWSASFASAFSRLRDCEIVGAAGDRLLNLLATPNATFGNREVMRRLLRQTTVSPSHVGPTRKQFEFLVRGKNETSG